jgi:hypothetical protein
MSGNLKGQGGIKRLLLQHGEKAAIALVGLVALWLIYKTTALPRLEDKYKAGKLHDEISQTSAAVRDAQWPEAGSELAAEVHSAAPVDVKADAPIDPKLYVGSPGGFDRAVVAPAVRRTDPTLLNAVGVRATGGSGLFAFIDEAIRKKQELKRAAEAAELAKKEQDRLEKEAKNPPNAVGEGNRRNNNLGPGGEMGMMTEFDPKHPKRRPVAGMTRPLGVPLQGGERIERAYWAIVVAKVPIREQLKLYQDAFEKAKLGFDPMRDFPQYKGYLVQRAEVVPGQELVWTPVPVFDGQRKSIAANKPIHPSAMATSIMNQLLVAASQFWAGMSPDVIDPRYSDYVLTFPLPPLVGRDWGREATHPDIPLIAETPPLEEELSPLAPAPGTSEQPATASENSPFSSAIPPGAVPGMVPGMGPGAGRMSDYGRPGPGPGGYGSRMSMGQRSRYSSEYEGPGMAGEMGRGMMGRGLAGPEGGRSYAGAMPGAATTRTSLPKGVDYLLLRFFDFTVEPGKRYKYRVSLVLADPNYMLPESALAATVLDRQSKEAQAARAEKRPLPDFRRVEGWSDPSPTVGIPLSGGAQLVDIETPSADRFNDEPTAKLLVDSFDTDDEGNAIEAAVERKFRRGNVANMVEKVEYLVEGGLAIDTRDAFKFVTGMTVLDMDGGGKLAKDMTVPSRVMLMGPAGELYIHNELDDKTAVEYHKMLFMEDKRFGPGGPEGLGPGSRQPPGRGGRGGRGGRN